MAEAVSVEGLTRQIGGDLLEAARGRGGILSGRAWSDRLMQWATKDPAFRAQLFRFIDVFPVLRTPQQVHEHLRQYLDRPDLTPPAGFSLGLKAGGLFQETLASTIASQITAMAGRFIAGADVDAALPVLRRQWDQGIAFSVDLLGEACVSEAEAEAYRAQYLGLIPRLAAEVRSWPGRETLDHDHLGPVPRANISIKISSLSGHINVVDFDGTIARLVAALEPILSAAHEHGVFVNFDMEHHELKDLTLELFMRCRESIDFDGGVAMQAYLRSAEADARRLVEWAQRTGRVVTVRLVKGAYWDYETIVAGQKGWLPPVWARKVDTDACFERVCAMLVEATPRRAGEGGVKLAVGSHNVRSIARALALVRQAALPDSALELQMLRGMADPLKRAAAERGLRVREYVPVGAMIPGMAYLVRRLLENTSNESWLRAGFESDANADELLASPHDRALVDPHAPEDPAVVGLAKLGERHQLAPPWDGAAPAGRAFFFNEPPRDFADARQRAELDAAIASVRVPAVAVDATVQQAADAVGRAAAAFESWRQVDPAERARILLDAAEQMRRRRAELAAIIVHESKKVRAEADADVCEAIDFCEYYARSAVELFRPRRLGHFAGELNEAWHDPRGVAVVISPWNFPLAILCGMTAAALVTGNTVLMKPAEQSPAIAHVLCDILWQAGTPREVLHFIPGVGETVGAALVRDPRVSLIAFTGSMAVGLEIIRAAGQTAPDQPFVKRVICEMGGKNAVIVDESADLDEAVLGVRASAFGYAGQKCSACSRLIVLDSIHDALLARLVESTRSLVTGEATDPATDVPPLIDAAAAQKVWQYIEIGRGEGKLELGGGRPGDVLVPPHIFSGIRPEHRLAREEIFGPVLSVMRAADFDEALGIANGVGYKLTGGVFSRTPAHLERARRDFRVGNLYLNRTITGALVGRQPFGGFGLSGIGAKAGGPEYLLQFVNPRACTENTLRRGFAPDR